jgi:hypothetical protein
MRQPTKLFVVGSVLVTSGVLFWAPRADAQEYYQTYRERPAAPPYPPPSRAFELRVGGGYTQGFGNVAPNQSIKGVAGAGIGGSLDLDYRANPWISGGLESQYQEFATGRNSASRGLNFNLGVTYHVLPARTADPFIRLGTGYRMLWDVHPDAAPLTTNLYHGWQIATLKVGLDLRGDPNFALAPVVGADLQLFSWKDADSLSSSQIGTFIYAGIQGRFDTGGHYAGAGVASTR